VTEIASAPITSKKGGHFIKRTLRIVLLSLLGLILSVVAMLYWQAGQKPQGAPKLVALGSSFAAGIGLGDRAAGSPFVCQRSRNGYPQLLARLHHIPIVDMTCSGATAQYVRGGGQVFLGPQLDGLAKDTEWVTLTAGGNDISYVGDLSFLAARKDQTIMGWALRQFWNGPRKPEERGYAKLRVVLALTLAEIKQRAPNAKIIVVTYPTILPPTGSCAKLGLSVAEVDQMRAVGDRLANITSAAAQGASAIVVDMHQLGTGHDACSAEPWVNGWNNVAGTPFHPNMAGAKAAAMAISKAMDGAANPEP
jgi:lysophospholipase L1-like esterase